ncbi:hypothetical protein JYG30_25515 (plasmid) [Fibrella sp. USSR17]
MTQEIQPEQCVADAHILLDLSEARLLPSLLGSNVSLLITPLVVSDLDEACRRDMKTHIDKGQIQVLPASESDMNALLAEVGPASQLSGSDRLLCRIAKRMRESLLTGCDCLHRNAEKRGIRARSFVWVLDRLVNHGMLKPAMAARKLTELQSVNPWLNSKVCQERINVWQTMSRQPTIVASTIGVNLYSA